MFAFPTAKWAGGTVPTLTTTTGSTVTDVFTFFTVNNGGTLFGDVVGQNFQ